MKSLVDYICEVYDPSTQAHLQPIGDTGLYLGIDDRVTATIESDNSITVNNSHPGAGITIVGGKGVKDMKIRINAKSDKVGVALLSDWATSVSVETTGLPISISAGNTFFSKLPKCKVIDLSRSQLYNICIEGANAEEIIGGLGQIELCRIRKCNKLKTIDLSMADSLGRDPKTSIIMLDKNKALQTIKLPRVVTGNLQVPPQISGDILDNIDYKGSFIQR